MFPPLFLHPAVFTCRRRNYRRTQYIQFVLAIYITCDSLKYSHFERGMLPSFLQFFPNSIRKASFHFHTSHGFLPLCCRICLFCFLSIEKRFALCAEIVLLFLLQTHPSKTHSRLTRLKYALHSLMNRFSFTGQWWSIYRFSVCNWQNPSQTLSNNMSPALAARKALDGIPDTFYPLFHKFVQV